GTALADRFKAEKKWALVSGALEVLVQLHGRRLPLGLVANWDSNLSQLVEELGIKDLFNVIIASQEAGVEKPARELFQIAAARLGLVTEPSRILYVGNEYRADVLGARAAGLTPVLIDKDNWYRHVDCLRF